MPADYRTDLWLALLFLAGGLLPFFSTERYLIEALLSLSLSLIFVLSWDLFCGPTGETNFGHSFFIGGAAYLSAWLHASRGLSPWSSGLLALAATLAVGGTVGWIADRFRGPSFALATMAFQLMLFQAIFLFPGVFGGEEGIIGLEPLAGSHRGRYLLVLGAAAGVALLRSILERSRAGLRLTAIGENEVLAKSCGVRSRALKVSVFALSAASGGMGGILYAHTQGQVNAELASSALATHIVLLGLIGGARAGPILAVVLFFVLQRAMAGILPMAAMFYALVLVAAVLLFPAGLVPRSRSAER